MKKINDIHYKVLRKLIEQPETRNSDTILFLAICEDINPIACNMPFSVVLRNRKDMGLPNIETVGRARRKIQAEYEELRAVDEVIDERYENWKAAREYAAR